MLYTESKKYKITLAAFSSFFLFFFFLFFQPFGINNYRSDEKVSLVLLFVLIFLAVIIFFAILLCEFAIRPLLINNSTKTQFSIWILVELWLLATCSFLVYNILGEFHNFNFTSYLRHILELTVVLSFPFGMTIFYFKHTSILNEYMDVLSLSKDSDPMQEIVLLTGDYKNDQIALPLNSIIYMESKDNYVCLNYLEDSQLKKYLIRSTLSSLEQRLKPAFFLRCNRSIIANMIHLETFKFLHKKLVIKLNKVQDPITVSKSHQPKVLSFLERQSI